jgi:hypothetical protein
MKILWIFINFIIPACISLDTPKLCIHCKHFTKTFLDKNEFGKCVLFPKKIEDSNYFVTGKIEKYKPSYYYCSSARSSTTMCGPKGSFYEQN